MNKCKIVQDLIPLYADDVASADSVEYIYKHTETCPECRAMLERCRADMPPMPHEDLADFKRGMKKSRLKAFLNMLAIFLLFAAITAAMFVHHFWQRGDLTVKESYPAPDGQKSVDVVDLDLFGDIMTVRFEYQQPLGAINRYPRPWADLQVFWAQDSRICVMDVKTLEDTREIHIVDTTDHLTNGGTWEIPGDSGDILPALTDATGGTEFAFAHWESDCETAVFTWENGTVRYHYPTGTVAVDE